MTKKYRCEEIIKKLEIAFPTATFDLNFQNIYQLTVAILLAARCTDELVNRRTPRFFATFPDFESLQFANLQQIMDLLTDITYADAKARNLKSLATIVIENYRKILPNNFEQLSALPGIGRKSANTILSEGFGVPAIPVDTHIRCVAYRVGISANDNPLDVEHELCANIPQTNWQKATHLFVALGKNFCKAINPDCANCPIADLCRQTFRQKDNQLSLF